MRGVSSEGTPIFSSSGETRPDIISEAPLALSIEIDVMSRTRVGRSPTVVLNPCAAPSVNDAYKSFFETVRTSPKRKRSITIESEDIKFRLITPYFRAVFGFSLFKAAEL